MYLAPRRFHRVEHFFPKRYRTAGEHSRLREYSELSKQHEEVTQYLTRYYMTSKAFFRAPPPDQKASAP